MAELTNADLTDVGLGSISSDGKHTVTGDGLFDDLMEAVNAHLTAQYDLGRLSGSDYANVYLGATQSAMGQAVQYLLGKNNAALIDSQILLIDQQIKESEAKVELINAQAEEVAQNIELSQAQVEKTEAEISLLTAKEVTEGKQQSVLIAQENLYSEQAKGFYWNAMNKWAKLTADIESVYVSAEKDSQSFKNSSTQVAASKPTEDGGTVG